MPQSDGICAMIVHLELFELYGCGIYQFVTEIGHKIPFDCENEKVRNLINDPQLVSAIGHEGSFPFVSLISLSNIGKQCNICCANNFSKFQRSGCMSMKTSLPI